METSLRAGSEGFDGASCLYRVGLRKQCDRKKQRPLKDPLYAPRELLCVCGGGCPTLITQKLWEEHSH